MCWSGMTRCSSGGAELVRDWAHQIGVVCLLGLRATHLTVLELIGGVRAARRAQKGAQDSSLSSHNASQTEMICKCRLQGREVMGIDGD